MSHYRITHSRKDGADADRRLDGFLVNGQYIPIDTVISMIMNGHTFYVEVYGRPVEVIRQRHYYGREYLTTQGDGFPPNNLLALPDC